MKHESNEHFIRRLEAFSDIVIGFSLAQLGASLVIPQHSATLIENPGWFFGFLLAFGVVCSMWFFHHRLFSGYFVVKPLTVILNFVWLAVVVLLVYATELQVKIGDAVSVRMYFAAYTAAYAILGVQYAIARKNGADDGARRSAMFTFLWTSPFLLCFIMTCVLPPSAFTGIATTVIFIATVCASIKLAQRYPRASAESGP